MIRTLLFSLIILGPLFAPTAPLAQSFDWRQQIGTFRIGLLGERNNAAQKMRLGPLKELLEKELDMNVEFFLARDFTSLIQAQASSRIEYAVYSSSAYASAWLFCQCLEPLVSPLATDGSRGFYSVLIARQSDSLSLTDLRNKKVMLGHKDSFATHQFAKSMLLKEGVDTQGWLLETAPTPEYALNRFSKGSVDALFGWQPSQGAPELETNQGTLARLKNFRKSQTGELAILWRSPLIPYNVHAIRSALPQEAKDLLLGLFLTLKEQSADAYTLLEPAYGGGFTQAEHEDFAPIVDFVDGLRKPQGQN